MFWTMEKEKEKETSGAAIVTRRAEGCVKKH